MAGHAGLPYEKYNAGEMARRDFYDALAAFCQPERVLYPGSFIHVTASVDNDSNARRFIARMDDIVTFVNWHKLH